MKIPAYVRVAGSPIVRALRYDHWSRVRAGHLYDARPSPLPGALSYYCGRWKGTFQLDAFEPVNEPARDLYRHLEAERAATRIDPVPILCTLPPGVW